MKCLNCGKELSEGTMFCSECGTKVMDGNQANMQTVSIQQPTQNTTQNNQTVPIIQTGEDMNMSNESTETLPPRNDTFVLEHNNVNNRVEGTVPITDVIGNNANTAGQMSSNATYFGANEQPAEAQLKKKSKKKGKKKGLVIGVALIFVVALGGGAYFVYQYMNRPIAKIDDALKSNDIDDVIQLYDELDNEEDIASAQKKSLEYAKEQTDNYFNEVDGCDYTSTINVLNKLKDGILQDNPELDEMIQFVEKINNSRVAYNSAVKCMDAGNYLDAIGYFDQVVSEDSAYYNLAKTESATAMDTLIADTLATARAYEESGDYESARKVLQDCLVVVPNHTELVSELNLVNSKISDDEVNDYVEQVNSYKKDHEYAQAFAKLSEAKAKYGSDVMIINLEEDLIADYKRYEFSILEEYKKNNQYQEGLALLEEMLVYIPDDEEVNELYNAYLNQEPVLLLDMPVYEDQGGSSYNRIDIEATDTFGNEYAHAIWLYVGSSNECCYEYLNNKGYTHIGGTLAYGLSDCTKGKAVFLVYADDILVYESPEIDDNVKPFVFNADIGNCHKIRIAWKSVSDKGYIILDNCMLSIQ